ncbi:hypothetical protein FOMPIDRAFT_1125118, partial [Fomitopsis schrenkii]
VNSDPIFQALHFSWYNRHCTSGQDTPTDAPPMTMRRTGELKTNNHQFIPYPSKDMTGPVNGSIYLSIKNILEPLFDWLEAKLKDMLPDVYEQLDVYARLLPGNNHVLSAPFLGLVINLNVVTTAHRDAKDSCACLVLTIGDFEGSELVLYEPGLVIPLQNGDFVVFSSYHITHFNLHYRGRRSSIVLHTDREMVKWQTTRNGWSANSSLV